MDYKLSKHAMSVMNSRGIIDEWIDEAFENPSRKDIVAANEVHYFTRIFENDNRCLKVVLNPVSMVVITVYFDRTMRKKGCVNEN
jgi:hypothetical protein